jgi:hypothetical protein
VVVLGKSVTEGDVMERIDYFIRTIKLQDSAEICIAENTAKEILTASSPLDALSSFSLSKILQKDAESSSTVTITSMREFAMGYYSKSKFSKLPIVKIIKTEGDSGQTNASPIASKAAFVPSLLSAESEGQKKQNKQIFDATTTLLFSSGRPCCTLDKNGTLILNLLSHTVSEAAIEISNTELNGKTANLLLSLRQNFGSVRLRMDGGTPVLRVRLRVAAKIDDTDVTGPPDELVSSYVVPQNVLRDAEQKLTTLVVDAFEKSRGSGCDVFEIEDKLYRTANKYYPALKGRALSEARLDVKISVKSFK